jgi:hypothetical protein
MKLKVEKLSLADLKIALDLLQKEITRLNLKKSKDPKENKELNKYTLTKNLILDELKYRIKKIVE